MTHVLHWEVQKNANSRSIQFAMRDMIRKLEAAGCIIEKHNIQFLLNVYRPLPDKYTREDILATRKLVTNAIESVHKRAVRVFKGIKDESGDPIDLKQFIQG